MDIGGIFSAIAGGAGGGIIGGVLGLGKKFLADRHEAKILNIQVLERDKDRKHDLALADKEIERDMKAADANLQQAMFEADSEALTTASGNQDKEMSGLEMVIKRSYKWIVSLFIAPAFVSVVVCQKMVRIVLTVALVYFTFDIFNALNTEIDGISSLPVDDQAALFRQTIDSILSMAGMAVGFWFVARPEKANRS